MKNVFLIGNGESRKGLDLTKLKSKGRVYGCNAIYREFTPDVLISVDHGIMHEIYHSGYTINNECWFRDWTTVPEYMYESLVWGGVSAEDRKEITESDLKYINEKGDSTEFVMHGANLSGLATILRKDKTKFKKMVDQTVTKISWIKKDKVKNLNEIMPNNRDVGWASGALTGYVACSLEKPDVAYLIGQDLVSNTGNVNNMYKGSLQYRLPESKQPPPQNWITQWSILFKDNPNTMFYKVNTGLDGDKTNEPVNEWREFKNVKYITLKELDNRLNI